MWPSPHLEPRDLEGEPRPVSADLADLITEPLVGVGEFDQRRVRVDFDERGLGSIERRPGGLVHKA